MNTKTLKALVLTSLLLGAAAQARDGDGAAAVDINIADDSGREFRQYPLTQRDGSVYRAYLAADRGENYAVQVRNRGNRRVGVVIAVDGRNIISGDKSHLRPDERMYVLGPYEEATYRGWRTSRDRVNQFYFTTVDDSYADAWGDRTAMGVIAAAVYPERTFFRPPWRRHDDIARDERRSQRAPSTQAEPGTGFGDEEWSPARVVDFRPVSNPTAKVFIKYEWPATLCRKGIIRCERPNRFWPERESVYAPYPPGYRPPSPSSFDRSDGAW